MSQEGETGYDCSICDDGGEIVIAVVTEEPLDDEAFLAEDPVALCEDHYTELVEETEYFVRELPPVPDVRGGFARTTDGEGQEILYDHEISQDSWIRFDPTEDELDLTKYNS